MAETTTTTSWPSFLVATMRCATRLMAAASATEEPPYFCTTSPTAHSSHGLQCRWQSRRPADCAPRRPDRGTGSSEFGLDREQCFLGHLDLLVVVIEAGVGDQR